MSQFLRLGGIAVVFGIASGGWLVLGGITGMRASEQEHQLEGEIHELWGQPLTQSPPRFTLVSPHDVQEELSPDSSHIDVDLHSNARRKGLVWYPLYDVAFSGSWTYAVDSANTSNRAWVSFALPDAGATYDDFEIKVNGREYAANATPENGLLTVEVPVEGEEVRVHIGYKSRGSQQWRYRPTVGASVLDDFKLTMTTDFNAIDFPDATMSPSEKTRTADGWNLVWAFEHVVTGKGIGMVMPSHIQPGELASELSLSAPVSLFFFFVVLFVVALLRKIDIHPINYLFLASSFFAFHLLFAYSVDHLTVIPAFALSSLVSIVLVVSYLRLVVSSKFAFREAAAAQLVYLIGFSLAHFWEGFTGLAVTVLAIATLFIIMQATGRIRWSEVFAKPPSRPNLPQPPRGPMGGSPSVANAMPAPAAAAGG